MASKVLKEEKDMAAEYSGKQNEDPKLEQLDIFKIIDNSVENALINDFYAKEEITGLSDEQKISRLENFAKQSAGTTSIRTSFGYPVSTKEHLKRKKEQFGREESIDELKQLITQRDWLHVRMPQTFNYTGAVLLNHAFNGLYHSVIRHYDEWRHFIRSFDTELQHSNFNDIQPYLQNVSGAQDHITAGSAIRNYMEILNELRINNYVRFLDVQSSLYDLQLDLYSFVQGTVTFENYLGEGVTRNNQVRVFFKVNDSKVMAVGASSDIYPPERDFGDHRPIRRIETVFIMPWGTYERQHVSKLFK